MYADPPGRARDFIFTPMNEIVEKLLQPVSDSQPCGPDLSNTSRFDALEKALKGKPEVDFGNVKRPAEPPVWGEIRDQSIAFLQESKNLRVAVLLSCSWLKTAGLAGFRDGLELIDGMLERYWSHLYPSLDPDDANDPTQRLNILKALTEPRGAVFGGGWLTIVEYLHVTPLYFVKGNGAGNYDRLTAAQGQPPGEMDLPPIEQMAGVVEAALEAARKIDAVLTSALGADQSISFESLTTTLEGMGSALNRLAGKTSALPGGAAGSQGPAEAMGMAENRGSMASRADVVRRLEEICSYYEKFEPSSPVPFLLRRAQKLAMMNFVEAVQELNLATVDALKPSMGSGLPASAPQS